MGFSSMQSRALVFLTASMVSAFVFQEHIKNQLSNVVTVTTHSTGIPPLFRDPTRSTKLKATRPPPLPPPSSTTTATTRTKFVCHLAPFDSTTTTNTPVLRQEVDLEIAIMTKDQGPVDEYLIHQISNEIFDCQNPTENDATKTTRYNSKNSKTSNQQVRWTQEIRALGISALSISEVTARK
jgi:hypothetical protein